MNTSSRNKTGRQIISETEVNWDELAEIGIKREDMSDEEVEQLLYGEQGNVLALRLTLLGIDIVMDATLRLVDENNQTILEICSIKQA